MPETAGVGLHNRDAARAGGYPAFGVGRRELVRSPNQRRE